MATKWNYRFLESRISVQAAAAPTFAVLVPTHKVCYATKSGNNANSRE